MTKAFEGYGIRAAREGELSRLPEIEDSAGRLFASTAHPYVCEAPPLSMQILRRRFADGAVWVATATGGEVVGFAVADELGGEAYLSEIDVEPEHGRRGIGRRLVGAVLEWARVRGYASVTLSTFADVAWNAPFYASVGFVPVAETDLTPAMVEARDGEARAGLEVERRVFMRYRLAPRLRSER